MDFSYKELAILNQIISIALLSGKIKFDETTKSIHEKVANEILSRVDIKKEEG